MKNLILFCIISMSFHFAEANSSVFEEITILGRIDGHGAALRVVRSQEGDAISGMLQTKQLENELVGLQKGDEILIKGYMTYRNFSIEGGTQISPVFMVQSIRPISLSRLGKVENTKWPESSNELIYQKTYSPIGIPVTTQVASAITLTSSILLLQSLTSGPNDIQTKQQINTGLILFAGAMATGIFIYEQIVESKK